MNEIHRILYLSLGKVGIEIFLPTAWPGMGLRSRALLPHIFFFCKGPPTAQFFVLFFLNSRIVCSFSQRSQKQQWIIYLIWEKDILMTKGYGRVGSSIREINSWERTFNIESRIYGRIKFEYLRIIDFKVIKWNNYIYKNSLWNM